MSSNVYLRFSPALDVTGVFGASIEKSAFDDCDFHGGAMDLTGLDSLFVEVRLGTKTRLPFGTQTLPTSSVLSGSKWLPFQSTN